jgi:hypothetical protein
MSPHGAHTAQGREERYESGTTSQRARFYRYPMGRIAAIINDDRSLDQALKGLHRRT